MAMFSISPAVETFERSISTIVPGVATYSGAYVGTFQWGPVNTVSTISSENELRERFGKSNDDVYVSYLECRQFLSYSNRLELVRIVGDSAKNATSGGDGLGLTLDITAQNGSILSFTINVPGSAYTVGDIITIDGSTISDAYIKVTEVDNTGGVVSAILLSSGQGYNTDTYTTTIFKNLKIENLDDFEDNVIMPEVIAKYPGTLGNSILFSTARASEFERWTYRNRFINPPISDLITWNGDNVTNEFVIPNNEEYPSDGVLTVDGFTYTLGTNPGEYQIINGNTTVKFNTELETITSTANTTTYNLTNAYNLSTENSIVTIDGNQVELYDGNGDVPNGYVKIDNNILTIGNDKSYLSGNSSTIEFIISNVIDITDAVVTVDGIEKTVILTGTPVTGEVLVENDGLGNTRLLFAINEAPAIGSSNIIASYNFLDVGSIIEVYYGAPSLGDDNIKLFYNQDNIHAIVIDYDGKISQQELNVLEEWENLSLVENAKYLDGTTSYYIDAINTTSNYIWVGQSILKHNDKLLTGGVDDNIIDDALQGKLQDGYDLFRNSEELDIYHIILNGLSNITTTLFVKNLVAARADCVFYVSPPRNTVVKNRNNEVNDIKKFRTTIGSTSYGHLDGNWGYVYDRDSDKYRWIACASSSAGIYAETHYTTKPWFSGAGHNRGKYKNMLKLAWEPDKARRDQLYASQINPVCTFRGDGILLYGDKTLQTRPDAFDRMNVRWLFVTLRKGVSQITKYYLFEQNDEQTRKVLLASITPYIRQVQGDRGVYDFKIVIDESNNTPQIIDSNQLVGDIYVKPTKTVNYIPLTFTATTTGTSFEELT